MREGGGEIGLRGFLSGAEFTECGTEGEGPETFASAKTEIEEFGDAFELDAERGFVGGGEDDGLDEAAAGFDEDEFAADFFGRVDDAAKGEVGGELREVVGVVGAEFFLGRRQGAQGGFDLAQNRGSRGGRGEELVDATGESERPAGVEDASGDGHFKGGCGRGCASGGAKLLVPARAELGAPKALGTVAGFTRADGEAGEFSYAQAGGALIEVEVHSGVQSSTISVWRRR